MQRGFRVARAAALLLIASGASGAVSAYLPLLDERWIFVAAVAVIGAVEGFTIGIVAAILAVAADELVVHATFAFVPGRDTLLLAAGIGAVILARGARLAISRP